MTDLAILVRASIARAFPPAVKRDMITADLTLPAPANPIEAITGVRKSGKTFYLLQMMQQLINGGFPAKRVFYFNFSDSRLLPMDEDVIAAVAEEYWRQVPIAREKGCYFFFDNIHEVDNWENALWKLSKNENVTVVVAGSMLGRSAERIEAELESTDPSTSTDSSGLADSSESTDPSSSSSDSETGTKPSIHIHELLPLSFSEFCSFQGLVVQEVNDAIPAQSRTRFETLFDRFMEEGGFPGIQGMTHHEQVEILQGYVRESVASAVSSQLGCGDIRLANLFALFGLRSSAQSFSLNLIVEQFRTLGFKIYWEKADKILRLLEEAFLLDRLDDYSASLKVQSTSIPKVYAIDPGISLAVSQVGAEEAERRFETAVFLELRKQLVNLPSVMLSSYSVPKAGKNKVDFFLTDNAANKPIGLIQACSSLKSELTRQSEIDSLGAAMKATGLREGTIVTLREEETIETEHGTIRVVPAWKWSSQSE